MRKNEPDDTFPRTRLDNPSLRKRLPEMITETHVFHGSIIKKQSSSIRRRSHLERATRLFRRVEPFEQCYDLWTDRRERARFVGAVSIDPL